MSLYYASLLFLIFKINLSCIFSDKLINITKNIDKNRATKVEAQVDQLLCMTHGQGESKTRLPVAVFLQWTTQR